MMYEELTAEAQKCADVFLMPRFYEHVQQQTILSIEAAFGHAGINPDIVYFDATNADAVAVHGLGEFTKLPHEVLFAAQHLHAPKFRVMANNRVAVSAITPDNKRRESAMTALFRLQHHYDDFIQRTARSIRDRLGLVMPGGRDHTAAYAEFIEISVYDFDEHGNCLEE